MLDAHTCIIEYAAEHDKDLIVMGTHDRTGMSHLLMGSMVEPVVRTAPRAVMTVRANPRGRTQSPGTDEREAQPVQRRRA